MQMHYLPAYIQGEEGGKKINSLKTAAMSVINDLAGDTTDMVAMFWEKQLLSYNN